MIQDNSIVNPDERIVKVQEFVDGKETVFYAIRDVYLGYWRSSEPLHHCKAWTKDRRLRAEFANRGDAVDALMAIWRQRRGVPVRSDEVTKPESVAA